MSSWRSNSCKEVTGLYQHSGFKSLVFLSDVPSSEQSVGSLWAALRYPSPSSSESFGAFKTVSSGSCCSQPAPVLYKALWSLPSPPNQKSWCGWALAHWHSLTNRANCEQQLLEKSFSSHRSPIRSLEFDQGRRGAHSCPTSFPSSWRGEVEKLHLHVRNLCWIIPTSLTAPSD